MLDSSTCIHYKSSAWDATLASVTKFLWQSAYGGAIQMLFFQMKLLYLIKLIELEVPVEEV